MSIHFAKDEFASILDNEKLISERVIKFSPSANLFCSPLVPFETYFTYIVSTSSVDSVCVSLLITTAVTPDVSPFILIPPSASTFVYSFTGIFKKNGSSFTAKYESSKETPPGMTIEPSLKKYCPNFSI